MKTEKQQHVFIEIIGGESVERVRYLESFAALAAEAGGIVGKLPREESPESHERIYSFSTDSEKQDFLLKAHGVCRKRRDCSCRPLSSQVLCAIYQ